MTPEERSALTQELAELKKLARLEEIQTIRQSGQSAYDSLGAVDKFGVGVAKNAINTWYGIKDFFGGDLSQEEQDDLERLAGTEGGWATAGEVAGDLATFALPAAKLGQFVTKLSTKAPKLLAKAAPFLTDLGFSVVTEGIKAPTIGTDRTDRMVDTVQGYLATAGGLGILKKLKSGVFTPTEAAQKLIDEGVNLTPAQAKEGGSKLLNSVEGLLESLPIVGENVTNLKSQALKDWNKNLLNNPSVNPISETIENAGSQGFADLQGNFSKAYDEVWGDIKKEDLDWNDLSKTFNNAIEFAGDNVASGDVNPVRKVIKNAADEMDRFSKSGDVKALERADDLLRANPEMDYSSKQLLKSLRDEIRGGMPGSKGERLAEIDKAYGNYGVLQRGGSYVDALKNDQVVSPVNLIGAVKAKSGERALTRGEGRLQKEATEALDILGDSRPQNRKLVKALGGLGTAGAFLADPSLGTLAVGASALPLTSAPFNKFLTQGIPSKEKTLSDLLRGSPAQPLGATPAQKGFTPDELNRLLMRSGGYYGASDSEN